MENKCSEYSSKQLINDHNLARWINMLKHQRPQMKYNLYTVQQLRDCWEVQGKYMKPFNIISILMGDCTYILTFLNYSYSYSKSKVSPGS